MEHKALILIPARYESSRFPGKPLHPIMGKTMIQRVYENCARSDIPSFVVTDDERIEKHVLSFGGKVVRIDDAVTTGTERIFLGFDRHFASKGFDYVINVQGDEPLLSSSTIKELARFHQKSSADIATIVKRQEGFGADFQNPNKVKVVYSEKDGRCFYFSRATIPYERNPGEIKNTFWYLHIGVYSYKASALKVFCHQPPSYLEKMEKLEQLRGLEAGLSYSAIICKDKLVGVDTPEDVLKVEEVLRGQG